METKNKLVVIESPLAGDIKFNIEYAKHCVLDSLERGEYPYASHLLFNQPGLLDDNIPEERLSGVEAGLAWSAKADLVAVYVDHGISDGMRKGIRQADNLGIPVELRRLQRYLRFLVTI